MNGHAGFVLQAAARGLGSTWRVEAQGEAYLAERRAAGSPTLLVLWHGTLLPLLWRHRGDGTTVLVSPSRDGEHLSRVATSWGYRIARGSSSRGAIAGLRNVLRLLASGGEVAMTPDGPRGPARVVKAGIIAAAQRVGAAVIAVGVGASSLWRARSWDAFMVPRPFSRVRVVYDEPLLIPRDASQASAVSAVQSRLNHVSEKAAWI